MLVNSAIAFLVIFSVLLAWVAIQFLARAFAARHPEFGPAREEGAGCGLFCGGNKACLFNKAGFCTKDKNENIRQ